MSQTQVQLEAASAADLMTSAYEHAYEQGWTDGLPIIPATPEKVAQFVAAAGRGADEVIGNPLPPRKGQATVAVIAANAIMAGCRAEYMPVIIAAVEGLTEANKFYVIASGAKPAAAKNCDNEACTAQELASFDLVQWRSQVETLPDGKSSITQAVDAVTGQVTHTITVFWNEERDPAAVGTGCDPNDKTDLRCIQLTM